jgi:hypothetical protein
LSTYYLDTSDVIQNFSEVCNGIGSIVIWETLMLGYDRPYKSVIFHTKVIAALFLDNNK